MTPQTIKVACSNCNLRELCMPVGLEPREMEKLDELVATRRKIKRGGNLFANGEPFTALYAIRTGFFKTCVTTEDGRDQVTGFQMAGEIIGLDGIVNDRHTCDAVALEDAEVCVMPFDRIEELSRDVTALQRHVHQIMSREIVREHGVMLLNRVLTVRPGEPGSHRGKGWEQVTEHAIRVLVQRDAPLVAILWGRDAANLAPMLGRVPFVTSAHPSPLSASRGFFGSKPFSRANELLAAQGAAPVDWRVV